MAGEYGRVLGSFWTDPDIKRPLEPLQKCLLLYWFTAPRKNMIGLYYCPFAFAASETGIPEADVRAWTLSVLSPFVTYDEETEEILVHNLARHSIGQELQPRDNRRSTIEALHDEAHSDALKDLFAELYADWNLELRTSKEGRPSPTPYEGASEGLPEGLPKGLPSPPPSPSEASSSSSSSRSTSKRTTTAAARAGAEASAPASAPPRARDPDPPFPAGDPPPEPEPDVQPAAVAAELVEIATGWADEHLAKPERRKALVAKVESFVELDQTAWALEDGSLAPYRERPRLLRLALARIAAGDAKDLRQSLRYAVRSQLGGTTPKSTNGNGRSPAEKQPQERPANTVTPEEQRAREQRRKAAEERHAQLVSEWRERREKAWKALRPAKRKAHRTAAESALSTVLRRASPEKREQAIMHAVFVAMGQEDQDPYPEPPP